MKLSINNIKEWLTVKIYYFFTTIILKVSKKSNQKIIFVLLRDGIGFRFRDIAVYLTLAKQKNITPIFLWSQNEDVGYVSNIDVLLSNQIPCIGIKDSDPIKRYGSGYMDISEEFDSPRKKIVLDALRKTNTKLSSSYKYFWSDDLHIQNLPKFLNNFEIKVNRQMMKKEVQNFEPIEPLRRIIDEFRNKNFNGKILGIHVRGGDIRFQSDTINKEAYEIRAGRFLKIETYIKEIKKIEKKYDKIFVSCEDKDYLDELKIVFNTKLIYFEKEHGKSNEKHIQDALIEMYLLSYCDFILRSKSRFSLISSFLGKVPIKILRDVDSK